MQEKEERRESLSVAMRLSPTGEEEATKGRRGALCVSENGALIDGSVAVMRYQPLANKPTSIKKKKRSERSGEDDEGMEGKG